MFPKTLCWVLFKLIKEPDYYSQSFFSLRQTRSDEIFVKFDQLKEYLGNASKLSLKVPLLIFLFKRNIQTRMRLKGPPFSVFRRCETFFDFFVFKVSPFVYIESPLLITGVKRYIQNFDVISELYCVFITRRQRSQNWGSS